MVTASFGSDIQSIESALPYSFEHSQLKADLVTFPQDVATYNSNLRQVWSIAKVPNPPVL
jgi:hypothetical protein